MPRRCLVRPTKRGNMFKRIDHVELIPSDIEATIKFYTEILGFTLAERKPVEGIGTLKEYVYLELGDTRLELMAYEETGPKPKKLIHIGYNAISIEVDDMDLAVAHLKEKGVALSADPVDLGHCIRAEIKDPDGLPIELMQW